MTFISLSKMGGEGEIGGRATTKQDSVFSILFTRIITVSRYLYAGVLFDGHKLRLLVLRNISKCSMHVCTRIHINIFVHICAYTICIYVKVHICFSMYRYVSA